MRLLALALALILGIVFPYGHGLTFLVRYSVMAMLLFAFLDITIDRKVIQRSHIWTSVANLALPWGIFFLLRPISDLLALTGFVTAILPTAAAAPVLTGFLKGNVAYVTFSVLLTSCLVGIEIPLSLPFLAEETDSISISEVLIPVLATIMLPLLAAQGIRRYLPGLHKSLLRIGILSFYLFILNVYIAMSKATWFLTTEMPEAQQELLGLLATVMGICAFNFGIGAILGGKDNRIGGSMALGRKNTMFGVWVCLSFLSPIIAIGPMGYIIFQNLLNSLQLMLQKKQERD
ncbi:MAG: hypothetical protein AAF587_27330 [Bacteroidota bacterium]